VDGSFALLAILAIFIGLYIIALPVKMAAAMMGAERTGMFSSLVALVIASVLHGLGLAVPVIGTIVAFLLSALGFAIILGTDYFRGLGIAIFHILFTVILVVVLTAVFGVSLVGILSAVQGY